jgi:hypothetical protein
VIDRMAPYRMCLSGLPHAACMFTYGTMGTVVRPVAGCRGTGVGCKLPGHTRMFGCSDCWPTQVYPEARAEAIARGGC